MRVSLLVITHDEVGAALIATATRTLGRCPMPVELMRVSDDCNPDILIAKGRELVDRLDVGAGVLVLTDLYGSTPSNVSMRLNDPNRVRVVAGINLPMLIRVLNYAELPLKELVDKAVTGGRDGIAEVGACE
jgi:PTS system ascorbate-specific IIA component